MGLFELMAGSGKKEIILDNVDTVFISCHPIKVQLSQVQEKREVGRMVKE